MILDLKKEYGNQKLAIIALELIDQIESIFDIKKIENGHQKYLKHFLNNGLGGLVDTLSIECNHTVNSESKLLHNYLLNIRRLKYILDLAITLTEDQKLEFLNIIKDKGENNNFKSSLSMLLKILNGLKTKYASI